MKFCKHILTFILLLLLVCTLEAQIEDGVLSDLENNELNGDNAEAYLDILEQRNNNQTIIYNINTMSREEMLLLGLNNLQIFSLENYILRTGQLFSINELKFVNGFDTETIDRISGYITAIPIKAKHPLRYDSIIKYARQQIRFQYIQNLNTPYGYTRQDGKGFKGDNFSSSLRYKMQYYDRMEFKFTAEKDYGEPLYSKDKIYGYDHYSFSLTFKDIGAYLKQITIGDYRINMGEGLAMKQGFSMGYFSSYAGSKHSADEITSYAGTSEYDYNRGIAAKIQAGNFDVLLFGAYNEVDFNGKTLQTTGYHRTESEIMQKHSNAVTLGGGSVQYWNHGLNFGVTFFAYHYKDSLHKGNQTYQQYFFEGNDNNIASFNSSYTWHNKIIFAEVSRSKNDAFAELLGVQITMGYKSSISAVLRNYAPDYQNNYSDALGVQSHNHNERGLYIDYSKYFSRRLSVFAGADMFYFPKISYRANRSVYGQRIRLQLDYKPNEKNEINAYWRFQNRQYNDTTSSGTIQPCDNIVTQLQLRYRLTLTEGLSLVDKCGYSHSFTNDADDNYGFYNYVELIGRFQRSAVYFNLRWTYFRTTDYDNRFYLYEYSLPLAFSSSLLYHTGNKIYAMVGCKLYKNLMIYLRYTLTRYNNTYEISSGNDKITGNIRHYIGGQLYYKF